MITITFDKPVNPPKIYNEFLQAGFRVVELRLGEHITLDTDNEAEVQSIYDAHIPDRSTEEKWAAVRSERRTLLLASDWTQLSDVPLTANEKQAWAVYRQALRDITDTFANPDDVEFPEEPGQQQ